MFGITHLLDQNMFSLRRFVLLSSLTLLWANLGQAQLSGNLGNSGFEQDLTRARIGEQRVQRQTEVMRLEAILDRLDSRLTRIERSMLANSRLPSFTVAESEASLKFSQAQLSACEQADNQQGDRELQLAKYRLAVVQAQGQLKVTKAADAERLLLLELELLHAERKLVVAAQEMNQLERLVARGYASSEGLKVKQNDQDIAEKEVRLAKLRLDTHKNVGQPSSD